MEFHGSLNFNGLWPAIRGGVSVSALFVLCLALGLPLLIISGTAAAILVTLWADLSAAGVPRLLAADIAFLAHEYSRDFRNNFRPPSPAPVPDLCFWRNGTEKSCFEPTRERKCYWADGSVADCVELDRTAA